MSVKFVHFTKGFSLYTLVIGLLSATIYFWLPSVPLSSAFLYILIFMFALTIFLTRLLVKSMENKLSRFVNAFMLLNFAKLLLYILLIFGYAWFNKAGAVSFIITFFAYYILFTAYEVVFLLKISK